MEEIAALAGLAKRTVYNNFADKDALFTQIVAEVIAYAEEFARRLHEEFAAGITAANLRPSLDDLGRRLALRILSPEVIALRRLLIGEARAFPALASPPMIGARRSPSVSEHIEESAGRSRTIGTLKGSANRNIPRSDSSSSSAWANCSPMVGSSSSVSDGKSSLVNVLTVAPGSRAARIDTPGLPSSSVCPPITASADDARIGDTHVGMGMVAGDGGAIIWPLLVGPHRAKEMLLGSELVPGGCACQ